MARKRSREELKAIFSEKTKNNKLIKITKSDIGIFKITGDDSPQSTQSRDRAFEIANAKVDSQNKRFERLKKSKLGVPKGIEPIEPFSVKEKTRILSEADLSQLPFQDLEKRRSQIDNELGKIFFKESGKKFFSTEVAFKHEGKLNSKFDVLLQERRKVQGALNRKTIRSLS